MTATGGISQTGSILDKIVADKREQLAERQQREPERDLRDRFADYDSQWHLSRAITTPRGAAPASARIQVIAEIKKASPSKGTLAPNLDYRHVANQYTLAGAAGISVLTEANYFLGDIEWLRDLRVQLQEGFPDTRPSLLRKDFLVEPYELVQARAYGADNILLIVALLEASLLRDLIQQAEELDLEALVEVHSEAEAERAMTAGTTLFGINNRDLHTFDVDLGTTDRIRHLLPAKAMVVAESGVHNKTDVQHLYASGARAILVGEAFMTAPNIGEKMAELRI